MSDSGQRPIQPGSRTPSAEMVLVPKRMLGRIYELLLRVDDRENARTLDRIETHAARRELEEFLQVVAPGLVLQVALLRADAEPTPTKFPSGEDMEKAKGGGP